MGRHHHRRRRNPSLPELTEGVDLVDVALATASYFAADLASNTYASMTGQTAPSPWLTVGVKALATIGLGLVAEELLGKGPSAFLGAGLNTAGTLVDVIAPSVGQPLPFPPAPTAPVTALPTGPISLTAAGAL
jgi:hypothetical protein